MNAIPRIFLCSLALAGWTMAGLPKKAPITLYAGLWTNSPFTSKPPPPPPVETVNPLEDYSLAGVSPIGGGYRITLLNKKKPEERLMIDTDKPKGEFKILEVMYTPGDPLATVVSLSTGSKTGTVAFDEKYLTLAAAPTARANPKSPTGIPIPGGQPALQPGQQPQRQPRPRVVPPTSPPTQPSSSSHSRPIQRGGR
jgi:hypothetical protein